MQLHIIAVFVCNSSFIVVKGIDTFFGRTPVMPNIRLEPRQCTLPRGSPIICVRPVILSLPNPFSGDTVGGIGSVGIFEGCWTNFGQL
jgi:hypothetical protein